jgi:cell division protein FtsB
MDTKELDEKIKSQNNKIDQLRHRDREINRFIEALENGHSLSQEQQMELIKSVSELLEER